MEARNWRYVRDGTNTRIGCVRGKQQSDWRGKRAERRKSKRSKQPYLDASCSCSCPSSDETLEAITGSLSRRYRTKRMNW